MKFSTVAVLLVSGATASVVTQTVHVTQYVYEDVHLYVDGNGNPVSTAVNLVSTNVVVPQSTAPAADAHSHYENAPYLISLSSQAPAPAVTSTTEAPAPAPETTTSQAPAPAPVTSSTEAPAPPPAPTTSSVAPAPAPTTSEAAPAPSSTSSGSGSGEFSGQGTYYDVGLGACGWTNTDADLIAALNVEQFGAQSNGNPVCGKKAKVTRGGKSVLVEITDKCPGCKYGDLDLSPAAFKELGDEAEGRIPIEWSFV